MKKLIVVLLVLLTACSKDLETDISNERDFSKLLGKRITIEGTASNTKYGALVITNDNASIWIDKLESWPAEYNASGTDGKTVIVTGVIVETYDSPVQIQKRESASQSKETPATSATGSDSPTRRYVIKDATWGLISN
ncbi:hypothetical protein [uncultured Kordia sp.]|uniref:hypothetical protein n=1 Tax=uncultured Kordia sp. TaxID=507699 RepID=UPI0026290ABC|nr:hypothetical protein [uncultured Kordia sp.]